MLSVARRLLVLAAFGLAMNCGGSVQTASTDGGAPGTQNGSARPNAGSGASSSTPMGEQGGGRSNGSSPPGVEPTVDDGGCSGTLPPLASTDPVTSACWSCVAKGCASQLAACADDCACSAGVSAALGCVTSASNVEGCFTPGSSDDSALSALDLCITQASFECTCGNGPVLDASGGCVQTGGGGSGGNGQCTSNFGETCGSASYQVVCACPQGSCVCFSDASTTIVKISSCPYCPGGPGPTSATDLYDLCGFPH